MSLLSEACEIIDHLCERYNDGTYNDRLIQLEDAAKAEQVYAPTDGWRWCIRHGGPIQTEKGAAANRCMAWFWEEVEFGGQHDDPGKCVKVPMYIDAEDP